MERPRHTAGPRCVVDLQNKKADSLRGGEVLDPAPDAPAEVAVLEGIRLERLLAAWAHAADQDTERYPRFGVPDHDGGCRKRISKQLPANLALLGNRELHGQTKTHLFILRSS